MVVLETRLLWSVVVLVEGKDGGGAKDLVSVNNLSHIDW